ncbi:unnamed protein product [Clonostachys byssicola]|uniref:Uncharacterized protein n=1 Tax=Clonostachys byssicola TaxID=160290 RepID=A0A9N9UXB6_9HYPO|nr:unnamed protein product [Clonostachys byssicola]
MKLSSPLAFFLFLSGGVAAHQYRRQSYSGTVHLDARSQKLPVRAVAKGRKPATNSRAKAPTEYVV